MVVQIVPTTMTEDNDMKFNIPLHCINSSTPGRFEWNLMYVILKLILVIGDWGISWVNAIRWMSLDHIDGKLTVKIKYWANVDPNLFHHMGSLGLN